MWRPESDDCRCSGTTFPGVPALAARTPHPGVGGGAGSADRRAAPRGSAPTPIADLSPVPRDSPKCLTLRDRSPLSPWARWPGRPADTGDPRCSAQTVSAGWCKQASQGPRFKSSRFALRFAFLKKSCSTCGKLVGL